MGNRGALTEVKNAHPSEFWMRMGFGWGRMGILQAVTIYLLHARLARGPRAGPRGVDRRGGGKGAVESWQVKC